MNAASQNSTHPQWSSKDIQHQNIVDQSEHGVDTGHDIMSTAEYMPIVQETYAENKRENFNTGFDGFTWHILFPRTISGEAFYHTLVNRDVLCDAYCPLTSGANPLVDK